MPQQNIKLRRYKFSQSNEIEMHRLFLGNKTAVNLYTAMKNIKCGGCSWAGALQNRQFESIQIWQV